MDKNLKAFLVIIFILLIAGCRKQQINYSVPDWAKKVVWYQIFPDRFYNADSSNDPKIEDILGSWPFGDTREIQTVPWTSDWYELQPWEQDAKGFYYHAQRRRFGGNFKKAGLSHRTRRQCDLFKSGV